MKTPKALQAKMTHQNARKISGNVTSLFVIWRNICEQKRKVTPQSGIFHKKQTKKQYALFLDLEQQEKIAFRVWKTAQRFSAGRHLGYTDNVSTDKISRNLSYR